jgi:hypoxanthine phosphoribosyltransferase
MKTITQDIETILFTREQLAEKVRELGQAISEDYSDKELLVIGVLKGAGVFMSDLVREIDGDLRTDYMVVSSYGNETVSSGKLRMIKDVQPDMRGWHVLLVEDIVDTGNTLNVLKEIMLERGAQSVKICALLDKPSRRVKPVEVNYKGFEVRDEFIVGYGSDYAEKYRNLPFIGVLKKEIYE